MALAVINPGKQKIDTQNAPLVIFSLQDRNKITG
jgi:hypothetical protein